jgi:hypothetical protein
MAVHCGCGSSLALRASRRRDWAMGLGLWVPALRRRAGLSAPSLHEAFPRFVGSMGRSDFPPPRPTPPVALGVGVPGG